ncbi:hypothetical protein D3C87_1579140 [compost metagenome]
MQVGPVRRQRVLALDRAAQDHGQQVHQDQPDHPQHDRRWHGAARVVLLLRQLHREPTDAIAEQQAAGIAEEDQPPAQGTRHVEQQEAEDGAADQQADPIGARVADLVGEPCEPPEYDQRQTAGQPIHAIGHIDGVDHR